MPDLHTDDRKPITLDILRKIIVALPSVCTSHYEASLFSAIFTTAFFGYFRIGELVQNTSKEVGHAIQTSNVRYIASNNTIQISLKHSKTDQEGKGSLINLLQTTSFARCHRSRHSCQPDLIVPVASFVMLGARQSLDIRLCQFSLCLSQNWV